MLGGSADGHQACFLSIYLHHELWQAALATPQNGRRVVRLLAEGPCTQGQSLWRMRSQLDTKAGPGV